MVGIIFCDTCGWRPTGNYVLIEDMEAHWNIKKYPCSQCPTGHMSVLYGGYGDGTIVVMEEKECPTIGSGQMKTGSGESRGV